MQFLRLKGDNFTNFFFFLFFFLLGPVSENDDDDDDDEDDEEVGDDDADDGVVQINSDDSGRSKNELGFLQNPEYISYLSC